MSQVKLTLRPPPNIDFVNGYPGVPPGTDRPQAAVKGAIEVRVGPNGTKAKWVRIELRKVETLPGGGQSNTFYDFVGPSPVNLWTASDEYGMLKTQDFQFSIRIPESIPPSIALDNRAGINYELLASVCTKGKKGFLRRRKSTVVSTQAAIIIDKHELHSTWPVYCQPETRQIANEGVTLTVERNHTCYGPGDRVSVIATVQSDSLHTVILRGFELTLRETTVFRAGGAAAGKRSAPQVRVVTISETKLAVNATLYGGTQQRAELQCLVPPKHTTTTLNTARHIDITYVIGVKALMGTGTPLIMELPVIVSNWQRNVSFEAIRRIGPVPSLSLLPATTPTTPQGVISRIEPSIPSVAQTFSGFNRTPAPAAPTNLFSTVPAGGASQPNGLSHNSSQADEMGYTAQPQGQHRPSNSRASIDEYGRPVARAPSSSGGQSTTNQNRFTITNALPEEIPEDPPRPAQQVQPKRNASAGSKGGNAWPKAEEEKARLYEEARTRVERTHAMAARGASPPPVRTITPPQPAPAPAAAARGTPKNPAWPTAEEEKLRLFNQAQAAAKRTHGMDYSFQDSKSPGDNSPDDDRQKLFNQAQAAVKRAQGLDSHSSAGGSRSTPTNAVAGGSKGSQQPVKAPVPQYPSAEQEKAALRLYEEARKAVDRTQAYGYMSDEGAVKSATSSSGSSSPPTANPIAYDSLYPASVQGASSGSDQPPSFDRSGGETNAYMQLSEKERLKRTYEAQDAQAMGRQNSLQANGAPPPFTPSNGGGASRGGPTLSEKEQLQRNYAAQDAAAAAAQQAKTGRPPPVPPSSAGGRILTAAEEKALLKAKFDAHDSPPSRQKTPPRMNGNGVYTNGTVSSPASPPVPPPLMPKPPVEYIQETQEEDARVSRFVLGGAPIPPPEEAEPAEVIARAVSPFAPSKMPGPPPPLPPKPAGE